MGPAVGSPVIGEGPLICTAFPAKVSALNTTDTVNMSVTKHTDKE